MRRGILDTQEMPMLESRLVGLKAPQVARKASLEGSAFGAPSSRGLGRRPFKPETGIRIPLGLPYCVVDIGRGGAVSLGPKGRMAQWESACFTRRRSLVQIQLRPPQVGRFPIGAIGARANSSVGRALALHASGHRFEPCFAHCPGEFGSRKYVEASRGARAEVGSRSRSAVG